MASVMPQRNTAVYVLNTGIGSAEMMNFFLTPTDMKYDSNNTKTMQTNIPQNDVSDKETFNDRTRKSLLKINLFIKRLKWFNIFTTTETASNTTSNQQSSKVQKATEWQQQEEQKCNRFLTTKKSISTKEMYREAAKLLGIDCSLSSSCRCMDCQSRYFEYDPETEQIEDTDSDSSCDSDTDSYTSEYNENEHYITNCYLIHSEELCECCQMRNDKKSTESMFLNDCTTNDLSFNNFFS
ncbi:hypothetical protein ACKWTF_001100 [Chironomus riparius]